MRDPDSSLQIGRLKRRADFLRAAKGQRFHTDAMTVQATVQAAVKATGRDGDPGVRIGFTLTRKVGNAVVRNRARRRLKEAVRLSPDLPVVANHDYVIIGRIEAVRRRFDPLKRDLARAIRGVHEQHPRTTETRPKRTGPEP